MNRLLRTAFGAVTTVTALCALSVPAVAAGQAASAPTGTSSTRVQASGTAEPANTSWGNCRPTPTHDCKQYYPL
ncbi:hypothetical protein ACGFY6_23660 [Streptomyces sp. NPDC048387]|uniref:hypothetical protein n=1 Tax=unclassified Streptomyces TaxID=2593676 RepID=UPI0033E7842C